MDSYYVSIGPYVTPDKNNRIQTIRAYEQHIGDIQHEFRWNVDSRDLIWIKLSYQCGLNDMPCYVWKWAQKENKTICPYFMRNTKPAEKIRSDKCCIHIDVELPYSLTIKQQKCSLIAAAVDRIIVSIMFVDSRVLATTLKQKTFDPFNGVFTFTPRRQLTNKWNLLRNVVITKKIRKYCTCQTRQYNNNPLVFDNGWFHNDCVSASLVGISLNSKYGKIISFTYDKHYIIVAKFDGEETVIFTPYGADLTKTINNINENFTIITYVALEY